jgi:hypothetical protein
MMILVTTPAAAREDVVQPRIIVGVTAGYSNHFGKAMVDGVSGASQVSSKVTDHGASLGIFADFGLFRVGPGDLGLTTVFQVSVPHIYYDTGLWLRYRMDFATNSPQVPSVSPWVGVGATISFDERYLPQPFVMAPAVTLGCDVETNVPGLFFGVGLDIDMVDPRPVTTTGTFEGIEKSYRIRRDRITSLFRLSYRVF